VTRTPTWKKKFIVLMMAAIILGSTRIGSAQDFTVKLDRIRLGFLTTEKQPGLGTIVSGPEPRLSMTEGDPVYLRLRDHLLAGVKEYAVYRFAGEVRHPRSKKPLGRLVEGIGIIEIEQENFPYTKGVIRRSLSEASPGDWIAPIEIPSKSTSRGESSRVPQKVSGTIVALRANRLGVAEGDIVYLDIGSQQGISAGDRFYAFGAGAEYSGMSVPKGSGKEGRILAELVVVSTQNTSSTARVGKSVSELTLGTPVESAVGP